MDYRPKLYRLLRDDENPMLDGIKAKNPLAEDAPMMHIRNGSNRSSQWISASKSLSATDNFIKLKRKRERMFTMCRVVEIDEHMLMNYSEQNKITCVHLRNYLRLMKGYTTQLIDTIIKSDTVNKTGDILDFTDPNVMNKYIPSNPARSMINGRARGYAKKYSEVLVERFIPAECCICVYYR